MDPITKLMFRNYTLTSCSPLYPNLFKDGHGTWYEYGLRLRKCSSTPENFDLHSTPKEHHLAITYLQEGLFSTQDVLQSQKARNLRHNRKTIVGREVFRNEKGEFTHPNFQHWNLNWDEIDWPTDKWQSMLTNVKTKTLSFWEKAKELVISILTVYFLFCIVKHIPKIFVFGGLIWQGANMRQLLRVVDPITGTRMYNMFLKQREQRQTEIEREDHLPPSDILREFNLTSRQMQSEVEDNLPKEEPRKTSFI